MDTNYLFKCWAKEMELNRKRQNILRRHPPTSMNSRATLLMFFITGPAVETPAPISTATETRTANRSTATSTLSLILVVSMLVVLRHLVVNTQQGRNRALHPAPDPLFHQVHSMLLRQDWWRLTILPLLPTFFHPMKPTGFVLQACWKRKRSRFLTIKLLIITHPMPTCCRSRTMTAPCDQMILFAEEEPRRIPTPEISFFASSSRTIRFRTCCAPDEMKSLESQLNY